MLGLRLGLGLELGLGLGLRLGLGLELGLWLRRGANLPPVTPMVTREGSTPAAEAIALRMAVRWASL